ncbi:MAG: hypothetical protein EOP54_28425, partial [Sphingobacteriales bacterium]
MNRKKFLSLSGIAATALVLPSACKKALVPEGAPTGNPLTNAVQSNGLLFSKFRTDKGAYLLNEIVLPKFRYNYLGQEVEEGELLDVFESKTINSETNDKT